MYLLTILGIFTLLFPFGCSSSGSNSSQSETFEGERGESQTLLIYMCGSTLESRSGQETKNIQEMLQADIPKNVNVVLQTGGASSWKTDGISASSTDRFIIENGAHHDRPHNDIPT